MALWLVFKPNWQSSSNQSALTTQISMCQGLVCALEQGRVKCRRHVTVPVVPTQEAILEADNKKKSKDAVKFSSLNLNSFCLCFLTYIKFWISDHCGGSGDWKFLGDRCEELFRGIQREIQQHTRGTPTCLENNNVSLLKILARSNN